jgi:hypothetical protein
MRVSQDKIVIDIIRNYRADDHILEKQPKLSNRCFAISMGAGYSISGHRCARYGFTSEIIVYYLPHLYYGFTCMRDYRLRAFSRSGRLTRPDTPSFGALRFTKTARCGLHHPFCPPPGDTVVHKSLSVHNSLPCRYKLL